MKRTHSKETVERVAELSKTLNDSQIGKHLGLSKSQVYGIRKVNNIKHRHSTFQEGLLEQGFDGDNWSHGWLKTDKASIFIRNNEGFVTYDDVRDEMISEMKKYSPKYPVIKRKKIEEGHMLLLNPCDIHINKLASLAETDENYNVDIAINNVVEGVESILEKAKPFNIEKIMFIIGNDILHTDGSTSSTTRGTAQDTCVMWHEAFVKARELYVSTIERLLKVADVEVVFNPSNHDYASGFMLADSVSSWFSKNKNVTFDVSPNYRKYSTYGDNMIMTTHGDGAKEQDLPLLMASEKSEMWGQTKFRYVFMGHIHHKRQVKWLNGKDYFGVNIEYLRSVSGTDSWHQKNGYTAQPKTIEGFIFHKENAQVARLTHYIK